MNIVWWHYVLVFLCSYLIGNLTFARVVSMFKKQDVTKLGSGNPGTANILRHFGFKMGLITLILDILKGVVPTLITYYIFGKSDVMLFVSGLSVIVGHIYPVVFKFKGGKGIATMLGVFLVANPLMTLCVMAFAGLVWLCFEYSSVASFLCVTLLTVIEGFYAKLLPAPDGKIVCLLLFGIFASTWFAHRGNIERLLYGKENKVSLIKKSKKTLSKNK